MIALPTARSIDATAATRSPPRCLPDLHVRIVVADNHGDTGYACPVTGWTFLTNHAHVLVCINRDPGIRMRDIADRVGITERAAQRIVGELVDDGYVERERDGRRNHYKVKQDAPLRHPLDSGHSIGEILEALSIGEAGKP
jgi:DNA-binding transcriptional ArsR family regulator